MDGGDADDRNFDEKPIKPKANQNVQSKNPPKRNEIESVEN